MSHGAPRLLGRLAELLVRGPDAPHILADLDEAFARDLARGRPLRSARLRYAGNVLGSVLSTWRVARRPRWGGAWLDLKLGARMLLKHPLLTFVAMLTLALGIPVGLLPWHVIDALTAPLPFDDADGVVRVWNWDVAESRQGRRPIHDLPRWRTELSSLEHVGMGLSQAYNVISEEGRAAPVLGASMHASVFDALRVPPLLGRTLHEGDETVGAPDVVVIGYDLWRSRLAGDPDAVGRTIRVGSVSATVVGVMPDGFLFPHREHLWVPFRHDPLEFEPGEGPVGWVVGRLAPGVTLEEARTEAELLGQRMALASPDTHARLTPQIVPYTEAPVPGIDRPEGLELLVVQLLLLSLLALACSNVGVLMLARTASRTGEIAIRTALGAGRLRIVTQIFMECLVLSVLSAGVGLIGGQLVASHFDTAWPRLPFWVSFDITGRTVAVALSLAVLSAAMAGVVPALKATGRNVRLSMQRAANGGSGIRFGALSSALIVVQVGVAVLFISIGATLVPTVANRGGGVGIDAGQYLSASLRLPLPDLFSSDTAGARSELRARVRSAHDEIIRRLTDEPAVGPAAIATSLPGMTHRRRRVEVEGEPLSVDGRGHPVRAASVDIGFFAALDQRIRDGRDFTSADLGAGVAAIIVNETFVDRVLGGRQPIGRRVRYVTRAGASASPWHEIVGVVGHLGMNQLNSDLDEGIYHPAAPGELHPVRFAVRVGPDPESFVPRLRALAAEIDPSALIESTGPLDEAFNYDTALASWGLVFMAFASWVAVLLTAAGLYALMSFTVAERTREIGIRSALGARPAAVVTAIARRAFAQLLLGVSSGAVLACLLLRDVEPGGDVLQVVDWAVAVPAISLGVLAVGMLACISPTRRGLRIPPLEALRS